MCHLDNIELQPSVRIISPINTYHSLVKTAKPGWSFRYTNGAKD